MHFHAYFFLCILLKIVGCQEEDETNQNVIGILDKMTKEYEKVTERSGRFLFYPYNYYNPPQVGYQPPTLSQDPEVYDFIVVGSGSSGAAVASRLSENPLWKVLLLEVGKEASVITDLPAIAATFQFTDYNWNYLMEKQDNMCLGLIDQRMHWPRGRALGGTSIINYMIHTRGSRKDYDRWASMGNPGWDYNNVLPYLRKLEDSSLQYPDPGYHNIGGPVSVEDVKTRTTSVHAFINSAMEAGHRYVDYNGKRQMGVSYVQSTTRRGLRWNVEKAYLRGARSRPNLTISILSRATKLLMEGNRVTGVQYVRNRRYHTAKATKEVILSAGAFNSPQLLMLSGIGPRNHLQELGIPVVKDLPVGEKLYDHLCFLGLIFTVNETMTLNQNDLYQPSSFVELLSNGTGPLTSLGGVEALLYMQTEHSEPHLKSPDMELIFVGGGLHTDTGLVYRRMFRITDRVYDAIWKPLEGKQAWSVLPMLLHPRSKGYLKLKSKNPYHWPKFYGNFFTDPENLDIKAFISSIREVQRIAKSPTFQRFNAQIVSTPIPGCEHHTFNTDEYWECALRHVSATLHHQIATCKMGPQSDPEAVVSNKLKVYGVDGLRVADCSIIPVPLSAHTNIPAIMVGEKAADMIKEEWGAAAEIARAFDPRSAEVDDIADYDY